MSDLKFSSEALRLRVLEYLWQQNSPALAVLAPDLIVTEASERFSEFQGDSSLEPVGAHVSELIWELVGSEAVLNELLKGGQQIFVLENINRQMADGSIHYFTIKAIPLSEDEPGQGILLIIQDTTSTSMLEQQLVQDRNELRLIRNRLSQANDELQRLDRLKSLFLSIAAHDMRSPLTAIRGYTDLALRTLPPGSQSDPHEYLSIVISLVDTLNRLIADFLDLDTIQQGNLKIRPVSCDLNPNVLAVADVMRAVARRKGILIETELEQDLLPAIYADPDRIQQILFNLVGNAIKYTNEGDRVLIKTDLNEGEVTLSVIDHGPGIPESEIPRLFDLYHRTDEARQSGTKGLGLGLYIVKSLVDLQNGHIAVQSGLGKGTQFTVSFPVHGAATGGRA